MERVWTYIWGMNVSVKMTGKELTVKAAAGSYAIVQ